MYVPQYIFSNVQTIVLYGHALFDGVHKMSPVFLSGSEDFVAVVEESDNEETIEKEEAALQQVSLVHNMTLELAGRCERPETLGVYSSVFDARDATQAPA